MKKPQVGLIMGSQSDWETMQQTATILTDLNVNFETKIISAHRTPDRLFEYSSKAQEKGLKIIIAGAGVSAHLPGMVASKTLLPVIGVPIVATTLSGVDSLYSIVQMPRGYPVATMAIGAAGAVNAGLMAAAILGIEDCKILENLNLWKLALTESVSDSPKDD